MIDASEFSILAKLQAKLALDKARILADPFPFIEHQHKAIVRLMVFLHDVEYALTPDVVFDVATSMNIRPENFNGADHVKLVAIQKALDKYHMEKP